MEPLTIVWILLAIVILLAIFKLVKRLFPFALSAAGIIAVVWLVIAGLQYADETNLRNNLIASNNIFLLSDNGNMMTGFASDGSKIDINSLPDYTNPDSVIYDQYYKVIVVKKEALPEKTEIVLEAAGENDKMLLFESYIKNNLLPNNDSKQSINSLIEKEEQGLVAVHKESFAFKHGIREVLGI